MVHGLRSHLPLSVLSHPALIFWTFILCRYDRFNFLFYGLVITRFPWNAWIMNYTVQEHAASDDHVGKCTTVGQHLAVFTLIMSIVPVCPGLFHTRCPGASMIPAVPLVTTCECHAFYVMCIFLFMPRVQNQFSRVFSLTCPDCVHLVSHSPCTAML